MSTPHHLSLLVLPLFVMVACTGGQDKEGAEVGTEPVETTGHIVTEADDAETTRGKNLIIQSESYYTDILRDADGNISHAARPLLHKNELLKSYYQRIGCNDVDCKQEWITFTAIQYPKDSILQKWATDIVGSFYFDASRDLDIKVNGQQSEMNAEGEMVLNNTGCKPYGGVLANEKAVFDYYQAQLWVIGKKRSDEHGPSGRYGCILYRCWQSSEVASYFVAYSTDAHQPSEHYVTSFDRRNGQELRLADIVKDDYLAELNDLVVEAAHERHYALLHSKNNELAIDKEEGDYSSLVSINHVGFVEEGLAISTDALPFDQWAYATHVLIIPYEKVNHLIVDHFRR